jgi:hypothetical protein
MILLYNILGVYLDSIVMVAGLPWIAKADRAS